VVKITEAETRSKVFHLEHRGGGRISVEKHIVSRGTINMRMRELSGLPSQLHAKVSRDFALWRLLSSIVFEVG